MGICVHQGDSRRIAVFRLPAVCPSCGHPVSRDGDDAAVRCTNAACPAQLERNLIHFAARDAMDIDGMGEAEAFLADATLRARLVEISQALLELDTTDPVAVMGGIDALKLRSCMTLFSRANNTDPVFQAVLNKYYDGKPDLLTLELLSASRDTDRRV